MPSIHIPEKVFAQYADEYGYDSAKDEIKTIVEEHKP